MLGNALNVLGNHVRVKYEKNVLRIKRSLLTQVTLLKTFYLKELLCFLEVCAALVCLFKPPLIYGIFQLVAKRRGKVWSREG